MLPAENKHTKAQNLQKLISSNILHGIYEIGSKLPSEREMADTAGVSRDTVRQAYTELEKSGLLKRIQGSGTHILPEIKGNTKQPMAVALVCGESDIFGMEFILALEYALCKRNTLMILKIAKSPADEEVIMLDLMQKGFNNIIIWPSGHYKLHSPCTRLRALGANIVFFDKIFPNEYADFVGLDNDDAIESLLKHAHNQGAKLFTHISLTDDKGDSTKKREEAFIKWCKANSYSYDIHKIATGFSSQKQLHKITKKHKKDKKKRAYICLNDATALKLREADDNIDLIYGIDGIVSPYGDRITTFLQPLEKMANKAVELIFEQQRLGDKWKAKKIIMKGDLVDQY